MNENDYAHAYRTLGVRPSDSWEHVQRAYRRLVQKWHPDRLGAGGVASSDAEKATKALNLAFSMLSSHYRRFGTLPPISPPANQNEPVVPYQESADVDVGDSNDATPGVVRPTGAEAQSRTSGAGLFVAIAFLVGAYLVFAAGPFDWSAGSRSPGPARHESRIGATEKGTNPNRFPPSLIRPGATTAEVSAIQGAPSSVEENIWHYGHSKIYFQNDRVSGWLNHPENPLQVPSTEQSQPGEGRHFHVGSTKEEVRLIQGDPIEAHPDVWDYGLSRVYFHDDRVTGWDDSPLQPLRAKKATPGK